MKKDGGEGSGGALPAAQNESKGARPESTNGSDKADNKGNNGDLESEDELPILP